MFPLDDVIKSPGELQFQQRMKGNVKEVFGIAMTARFMGLTWGPHGAHMGPTGPRLTPYWPHETCYQGQYVLAQVRYGYK